MPDDTLTCEQCSKPIMANTFQDGTVWDVGQVVRNGRRKFNQQLCMVCYRKANRVVKAQDRQHRRNITGVLDELLGIVSALEVIELTNGNQHTAEVLQGLQMRMNEILVEVRTQQGQAVPSKPPAALTYIGGDEHDEPRTGDQAGD